MQDIKEKISLWERLKAKEKGVAEGKMSITDSMGMNLSRLQETVEESGAWRAAVHGVTDLSTEHHHQADSFQPLMSRNTGEDLLATRRRRLGAKEDPWLAVRLSRPTQVS